jgi:hypothetical protein
MAIALVKCVTFRIGVCPLPALWPRLVPLFAEGGAAQELFDRRRDGVLKVMLDPSA